MPAQLQTISRFSSQKVLKKILQQNVHVEAMILPLSAFF